MSPWELIIKKSLQSRVNNINLRSNSWSALSGLNSPSVSRIIKYSTALPTYYSSGIFFKVKFIPWVHFPVLVKNWVPKMELIRVDFPVYYGPITQTTIHLADSISLPRISFIISPLISRFLPFTSSNVSPSSICYLIDWVNFKFSISFYQ